MIIGNKSFDENRTHIMGILNATPDSFSDGGKWNNVDVALRHTESMLSEGAEIIDIGGESTRPGCTIISAEEEIRRVVPVIEAVKKEFNVPISVDTYKSSTARAAIGAGADLVNDIWGLKYDCEMAHTVQEFNVPICLMHNRKNADYTDFLNDVISDLKESIAIAKSAGITDDKIILDPGVGFAKTYAQNLQIVNHMELLHTLGYPLLLGASRKSIIGIALDLPKDERIEGTIATSVIACMKGAMFVRVHDIKENLRAVKMAETIKRSN